MADPGEGADCCRGLATPSIPRRPPSRRRAGTCASVQSKACALHAHASSSAATLLGSLAAEVARS